MRVYNQPHAAEWQYGPPFSRAAAASCGCSVASLSVTVAAIGISLLAALVASGLDARRFHNRGVLLHLSHEVAIEHFRRTARALEGEGVESRLHLRLGKECVDLLVKFRDDLARRRGEDAVEQPPIQNRGRQRMILEFIETFLVENDYPPTIRDIQHELNISSTSVVDYNLKILEARNLIRRNRNISRGIELVNRSGGNRNVVVNPYVICSS